MTGYDAIDAVWEWKNKVLDPITEKQTKQGRFTTKLVRKIKRKQVESVFIIDQDNVFKILP